MVSSTDSAIVSLVNSIVTKINTLIGNHNSSEAAHAGTFTELQTLINNTSTNGMVVLDKDYINTDNISEIHIDKALGIIGNGHTITTKGSTGFVISQPVYFEKTHFFSGTSTSGPFLVFTTTPTSVLIDSCSFVNVYSGTSLTVFANSQPNTITLKNCLFVNSRTSNTGNQNSYNCFYVNSEHPGITNYDYLTSHQDISGKVNISDIQDNLTSTDTNKPLSANQGKELKTLIDSKVDTSDSRLSDSRTPTSHTHGNLSNDGKIGSTSNRPLITGADGLITVGSFGTSGNTFCQGNDSRLSDARTPTSHKHGQITNTGTIGTTANKPLITTTSGKITTGSFGTTQNTFCQGNDSRLSDARTPLSHTHNKSEITDFPTIPSKTSDLTNDSGFLTQHQSLANYLQKSNTNGLVKNDGTIDTNNYLTEHQSLSDYMTRTEINTALNDMQTDFTQIDSVFDIYGAEVFFDDSDSLSVLNGKIYNDYTSTDSVFILRQGGPLDVEDIATTGHTHTYSNINNVSVVNLQINYSDNTSETVKLLKYTGS